MKNIGGELVEYIGDGVYAVYDGYGIELRANDYATPSDTIYIEENVLEALNIFFVNAKAASFDE